MDIATTQIFDRTAAEIAAVALCELFPGIDLLGGGPSSIGFAYRFRSAYPLPPEAEHLIEEKMRQIVRENREIRTFEMVPFSARELLLKKGLDSRADALEPEDLVEMVQIGSFVNASPGPHLESTASLAAFKLRPMQQDGDGSLTLLGCAGSCKETLKEFLKKLRAYADVSHIAQGLGRSYFRIIDGQLLWLDAGLGAMRAIVDTVRESLFSGSLEVSFPDLESISSLGASLAKEADPLLFAHLYDDPSPPWDAEVGLLGGEGKGQIRVVCSSFSHRCAEKLISFLQMTGKTLNILGFQHRLRLVRNRPGKNVQGFIEAFPGTEIEMQFSREGKAPRLEFLVEDRLGRNWPAFSVEGTASGFVVKASVERLLALLLERSTN